MPIVLSATVLFPQSETVEKNVRSVLLLETSFFVVFFFFCLFLDDDTRIISSVLFVFFHSSSFVHVHSCTQHTRPWLLLSSVGLDTTAHPDTQGGRGREENYCSHQIWTHDPLTVYPASTSSITHIRIHDKIKTKLVYKYNFITTKATSGWQFIPN